MLSFFDFTNHPGRLFVVATVLPLLPVLFLAIAATVRNLARSQRNQDGLASRCYWLLGGDHPLKTGGYLSIAAMLGAVALAAYATNSYLNDLKLLSDTPKVIEARWAERVDWIHIGASKLERPANALQLGYRIDRLSALMFCMVTVIGSLIFTFALGYMHSETKEFLPVDDGHGHHHGEHARTRRGRFGRFYLYLSLFAFSMFNLLIADNLFQIFVSWELVGVCSFFLIGFYYEKHSACVAANKAFIMNRIGDAGFIVGICVAFATFGTLNIQDLIHGLEKHPDQISQSLLLVMGLGIFLGAVGKSAQVPLQTWLPDAMEGPTPVSALIHAATMVAAGVYLVGRCHLLFSPDVMLTIAYVGLITLFISATIALVMTDIKRVLAFSTCSQLGFMMLALGIGAWTAGLLHLLTHAFFKALLFLGAGSVIHGLHHEQDLRKMGGLRRKMPITAYTMLIGVLAISGAPLFSGWYSKDQILSGALGFSLANPTHWALFFGPMLTAGLTAYYMFRLWFLAFAGEPRDKHLHDHAHESPWVMTIPLIILAAFSVGVAWGWPIWDAEASALGQMLHKEEPHSTWQAAINGHKEAHEHHLIAGGLALAMALIGAIVAWNAFGKPKIDAKRLAEPNGLGKFFAARWYFDAIYDRLFVRSTMNATVATAALDKENPDSKVRTAITLDGMLTGIATASMRVGQRLRAIQTGQIRSYVLVLLVTVVVLVGVVLASGGR